MRLETRFVQVPNNPQAINAINDLAAVWGWTVQSIQVTDTKISYEGNSSGWVTDYGYYGTKEIITEHTNYASITYQRDMDHPNYAQLVALEEEYDSCKYKNDWTESEKATFMKCNKRENILKVSLIVCITLSVVLPFTPLSILTDVFFLAAVANLIYRFFSPSFKKLKKESEELTRRSIEYEEACKRNIIQRAKSL